MKFDKLEQHDLIAVGSPTHFLTASKSIKEFLGYLETNRSNVAGAYDFAFDARFDNLFAGSAAR